jgi:hypothetical protein
MSNKNQQHCPPTFRVQHFSPPKLPSEESEPPAFNVNITDANFEQPQGRGIRINRPWDLNTITFCAAPVAKSRSNKPLSQLFETPQSSYSVLNFRQLLTPQTPSNTTLLPSNDSSHLLTHENMSGDSTDDSFLHFSGSIGCSACSASPSSPARPFNPSVILDNSLPSLDHEYSPLRSPVALKPSMSSQDPLQDKENSPPSSAMLTPVLPRPRRKYHSRMDVVGQILDILRSSRMSLPDFLVLVLDNAPSTFSTAFFAEGNSDRFHDILNILWRNPKGNRYMRDWMQSHAVDIVCDIIHQEMDCAKPQLRMTTAETTPEFISGWDINGLMEPIASTCTPIWSRILEAATESKGSTTKPNSRNR